MELIGANLGDLIMGMYNDLWVQSPSKAELGEQVFLNAAACWDGDMMVMSSRKMFNLLKSRCGLG
jgi:hypothetical protein